MKALIYPRKSTNRTIVLYCRLVHGGLRETFTTNIRIEPKAWNHKKQVISGSTVELKRASLELQRLKARIQHEYDKLMFDGQFSLKRLKGVLLGKTEYNPLLLEEFEKYIAYHQKNTTTEIKPITLKTYRAILNHLEVFIQTKYRRKDIPLRELDKAFIARFWEYIRGEQGVGNNAAVKYIRNTKKVIQTCVDKGYIDRHPFPDYNQKSVAEKKEFLTLAELERIEALDISIERLELIRDAFLFSCYTGLAYTDLKNLTIDHLYDGTVRMIKIPRQKTGVDSTVPVLPKAQEIMDKYAEHPLRLRDGVIIPVPSNQKTNAYLKEIADLARIKKNLTFHMARHTFGTTVTLSNNVPIETVSRMMGHSSLKMTQHYAKVLDAKIQADMLHLIHGTN